MKKICTKCNKSLDLNKFPNGTSKFGKSSWCKLCHNKYNKNNKKDRTKEKQDYYLKQKELYPCINSYKNAKQRSNNSKRKDYNRYGGRGIEFRLTMEEAQFMWIRDGADKMIRPSIDRIDNDGHYEISNCQFIELEKNIKKSILTRSRDKNGKFVK